MAGEHEQVDAEAIEDLELDDADSDINEAIGGSVPRPPGGPVPIPYPNTGG